MSNKLNVLTSLLIHFPLENTHIFVNDGKGNGLLTSGTETVPKQELIRIHFHIFQYNLTQNSLDLSCGFEKTFWQ